MFHNQSFGSVDPQFGLDNGFYVFVLPGLRMLVSAFTLLMFVALVFSVATHVRHGRHPLHDAGAWPRFVRHHEACPSPDRHLAGAVDAVLGQ